MLQTFLNKNNDLVQKCSCTQITVKKLEFAAGSEMQVALAHMQTEVQVSLKCSRKLPTRTSCPAAMAGRLVWFMP